LLAVGSEWGSYVALVGGAAGRGLAREVADEASEATRQTGRTASQTYPKISSRQVYYHRRPFTMTDERSFLDDPRPEGREPIPAERVPMLVSVFEQTEAVTVALAFTVRAEGVMQSDATFGVWLDESLAHEDKLETMRQLAARLHPIVNPDYYLDLMLITPRDAMLWQMATENGDPIFARDEEDIQAQLHLLQTLPPISDDERDIDVMRVM
jgi:hypothetical protein